jgi:recombination DNA repair RAD52 pathway protein
VDPPTGFSREQIEALSAPLSKENVKTRSQSGRRLSYVEGWHVIAEANRIFGFHAWDRETVALDCVAQDERTIGRDQKPGWRVTYTARVRITVRVPGQAPIIRDGCGAGHGIDVDRGLAHESALKEAETDAMKRALMTFGNPFGLALYDKEQREVEDAGRASAPARGGPSPQAGPPPPTRTIPQAARTEPVRRPVGASNPRTPAPVWRSATINDQ